MGKFLQGFLDLNETTFTSDEFDLFLNKYEHKFKYTSILNEIKSRLLNLNKKFNRVYNINNSSDFFVVILHRFKSKNFLLDIRYNKPTLFRTFSNNLW